MHHAGLTVSNIDRSIAFYTKELGGELVYAGDSERQGVPLRDFQKIVAVPSARLRYAFVKFGDTLLELICYVSPKGRRSPLAHNDVGTPHLAFRVRDIQRAYHRLSEKGVEFLNPPVEVRAKNKSWRSGWRFTYFRGPDNEFLEIFQELKQ